MASELELVSTSVVVAVHQVLVQCDQFVVFVFGESAKVPESMPVEPDELRVASAWLPESRCYGADPG